MKKMPAVEEVRFMTLCEGECISLGTMSREMSQHEGVSLTGTLHSYTFNYRIWALVWSFGGGHKKREICFRLVRVDIVRE